MVRGTKAQCGTTIKDGDVITFSYGIPPIVETADVTIEGGILTATMRGNSKPHKSSVRYLKQCVQLLYLKTPTTKG